jgi:hypothetical protein
MIEDSNRSAFAAVVGRVRAIPTCHRRTAGVSIVESGTDPNVGMMWRESNHP